MAAADRVYEVGRHALALQPRGAFKFYKGGLMTLPQLRGYAGNNPGYVPDAATLQRHGIRKPPEGETYTVLHVPLQWGPECYNALSRFHADVQAVGPIMAGDGQLVSWNHAAWFQFAPKGAQQAQPLLAVGGMPVFGNCKVTSFDNGHGTFSAVRALTALTACLRS